MGYSKAQVTVMVMYVWYAGGQAGGRQLEPEPLILDYEKKTKKSMGQLENENGTGEGCILQRDLELDHITAGKTKRRDPGIRERETIYTQHFSTRERKKNILEKGNERLSRSSRHEARKEKNKSKSSRNQRRQRPCTKLRPTSPAPPPIGAQSRCHNRLLLQSPCFRRSVDCSRSHNINGNFVGDSHTTRPS